jgi:hypothetical protein
MKQIRRQTGHSRCSSVAGLVIAAAFATQSLLPAAKAQGLGPDILYVGDESDDTVKRFDADTGAPIDANGAFINNTQCAPGDLLCPLHGPMGLLIAGAQLIVVNQEVNQPVNGEISQYLLNNGSFAGALVPNNDQNAPFLPRGAVLKNGMLYVANFVTDDSGAPGQVLAFAGNGHFQGELVPSSPGLRKKFHPRGVVVGPDGLLYVSSDPVLGGTGGQVLRFNPNTLDFIDVFIDDGGGAGRLNRPEGLVFDPDGTKLYVTSFCAVPSTCPTRSDIDSIRIYDAAKPNKLLGVIGLETNSTRAAAQALLFGPGGKLFVPVSFLPTFMGQVRRYDVVTKNFDVFVATGLLGRPFYLSFGRTDSASLAYPDQ